jgi:putative GTP pyrophosphokinase
MHDAERLREQYESRVPLLEALKSSLEQETKRALEDMPHVDRIVFRVKNVGQFVAKATDQRTSPPYSNPLAEIEDQIAGRIIVFFLQDVEAVISRLERTFNKVEQVHKRPAKDEEFGYESHHLVCMIPPHLVPDGWTGQSDLPTTFELQVRTLFMHAWAEPQHDLAYKAAGDLPPESRRELFWVAASAWGADQAYKRIWERKLPADRSS